MMAAQGRWFVYLKPAGAVELRIGPYATKAEAATACGEEFAGSAYAGVRLEEAPEPAPR
jgi:hypothetical protein